MLHFLAHEPIASTMKSTNFGYIPALDHLRGFAAVLVLFFHSSHFISHKLIYSTPYDPAKWAKAGNPFSALAIEGHTAVSLFFLLSGFVFTVGSLQKKLNYLGFYRNRLLRTYPLFLFFLTLGIAFNTENFSITALLQSVFFMANSDTAINGGAFTFVFWSIAVEWHFYLLFPLLLVCVQKWGWKVLPGLILALLVVRTGAYFAGADMRVLSYWTIVGRLDQFLLGMLAGIYYRNYFVAGKRLDYVAIGGAGLVLMLLFGFNQLGGGGANNYLWIFWPTLEAMAWAIFLIGYLSIARHFHRLVGNALVALGTISYSIYMGHYLVLDFFLRHEWESLWRLGDPVATAALNTFVFMLPLVLLLATITYFCVERPFLLRRRKYVQVAAPVAQGPEISAN
jgi:peptidoglycan/LPS O-acetylase OafA/YrhL|tara:strand:- start:66 stop:1253 length:1188 start_codon:yes stop_codon:yes gene_type:complete